MQKPETKFRLWFERELRKYTNTYWHVDCVVQKHADVVTSGIADIEVLLSGMTLWLELKVVPATTKQRRIGLTKLQERFLAIRKHHHIPAFALIGRPNGKTYDLALFVGPLPTHVHSESFTVLAMVAERLRAHALWAADRAKEKLSDIVRDNPADDELDMDDGFGTVIV